MKVLHACKVSHSLAELQFTLLSADNSGNTHLYIRHHHLLETCRLCHAAASFALTYIVMSAGLSRLTTLNMHGCEMVTSQGILSICGLINLQHLNLELCNRASGLEHMAGELTSHLCCSTHLLLQTPMQQQSYGAGNSNFGATICCCTHQQCSNSLVLQTPKLQNPSVAAQYLHAYR